MSERSFRRDYQRRIATAKRRESIRARKATAAAIAVGAFVLGAPAASSAANFVVNTNAAGGTTCDPNDTTVPCSLPDAVSQANGNAEDDVITFDSSLSGSTIDLNAAPYGGPIVVDTPDNLTITGPGANNLTVSGSGSTQVFDVVNTGNYPGLTISGLTITDGKDNLAGAIYNEGGSHLTLTDSVVSGSTAYGDAATSGPLLYFAAAGGGLTNFGFADVSNTLFTGNTSYSDSYYGGGGVDNGGRMTLTNSVITGNYAEGIGGGLFNGGSKYPVKLDMQNTTIAGNYANGGGGGVAAFDATASKYGASLNQITNSTITGNYADNPGAGVALKYVRGNDRWTISHSTVSDNQTTDVGGGLSLAFNTGTFTLIDSTISGNQAADVGGGIYAFGYAQKYPDSMQVQNSTIASNTADIVGGIALAANYGPYADQKYPVHTTIGSTILADNTAPDIDQETNGQGSGFDLSFDLVENVGNAEITELPPGSNIFGADPQLGALANNGGPTKTQLPAITSPVVDKGNAPSGLTTDQRGDPRTVDTSPANANDGTDIGAVELPTGPPAPPTGTTRGTKLHNVKKKHKKRSRVIKTFHKSAKVHLTFSSPVFGATFTCSVDGSPFEPCSSPFTARLKSGFGKGRKHTITIITRDSAGNQLGKARKFTFWIVRKQGGHHSG